MSPMMSQSPIFNITGYMWYLCVCHKAYPLVMYIIGNVMYALQTLSYALFLNYLFNSKTFHSLVCKTKITFVNKMLQFHIHTVQSKRYQNCYSKKKQNLYKHKIWCLYILLITLYVWTSYIVVQTFYMNVKWSYSIWIVGTVWPKHSCEWRHM